MKWCYIPCTKLQQHPNTVPTLQPELEQELSWKDDLQYADYQQFYYWPHTVKTEYICTYRVSNEITLRMSPKSPMNNLVVGSSNDHSPVVTRVKTQFKVAENSFLFFGDFRTRCDFSGVELYCFEWCAVFLGLLS